MIIMSNQASEPVESYSENRETWWYDSTITFSLTPPLFGWFDLWVAGTPRGGFPHINFSYIYDPLADFVEWVGKIAAGQLPAEVSLDEEGTHALFQAQLVKDRPDWIELKIDRLYGGENLEPKRIYWSRVNRHQLVREFCRRFEEWRTEDYRAGEWHRFGCAAEDANVCDDPQAMDITVLHRFGKVESVAPSAS